MSSSAKHIETEHVPPLDFLINDKIHPDNARAIEDERSRFRILGFWERIALTRYVRSLQRELKRKDYNALIVKRNALRDEYAALRDEYRTTMFINTQSFREFAGRVKHVQQQGIETNKQLEALAETYQRYKHYRSMLEYERTHKRDLRSEEQKEKTIRKAMRKESKWLESLLLDVFRKTPGCHYIYTDNKGKERTKTPKFERVSIKPDAHWFWLATSRRLPIVGYRWLLPYGVNIANLTDEKTIENMQAATGRQVQAVWSESGQLLFRINRLDSPDSLPKMVMWRDSIQYIPDEKRLRFPYAIGVSEGRKFQFLDLVSDPHILVAGKSQSGKSNLVNAIIAYFASQYSPDEVRFVLIDGKMKVEFTHWAELPHLLWDIAGRIEEIEPYLERIILVMRRRLELLTQAKAKDMTAYNNRVGEADKLARIVVVLDEMNIFVGLGAATEKIHNQIMLLTSQGRAAGIHVICATQYPEVKVIPGRIKVNMSVRICFPVPTVSASMVVLDTPAAASLPNVPGRNVTVIGMKEHIVQAPRIEDGDIALVVNRARILYPETTDDLKEIESDQTKQFIIWDEDKCIGAALEWMEGNLAGQRLHKMLGLDSPGERYLYNLYHKVIERAKAGEIIHHGGKRYTVKKQNRGFSLVAVDTDHAAKPNVQAVDHSVEPSGEPASQL
jgi:hypothetical protein